MAGEELISFPAVIILLKACIIDLWLIKLLKNGLLALISTIKII